MHVLIAAPEVAPIIKLGRLGDAVASLSKSLEKLNVNIDIVVPLFPQADIGDLKVYKSYELEVPFAGDSHKIEIYKTKLPDSKVDVFLIKSKKFAGGVELIHSQSLTEVEMFSFFDRCVVEFIKSGFNTYDLIHCNDWYTGLIPHLLTDEIGETRPAVLHTIHNLAYQGEASEVLVREIGFVPGSHPLIDWDIQDGDINFLLQGISSSDFVSTVSPSYAKEILDETLGEELSDVLSNRQARLVGILNGIDYPRFTRDYSIKDWQLEKNKHKKSLLKKLNLEVDIKKPLFVFVSSFISNQKGLDILYNSVQSIIENGSQFIFLGSGNTNLEKRFEKLQSSDDLKNNISINTDFNSDLAVKIYKAADFTLIPSKHEPCGHSQMVSMWYGAIPIAHATGGLKDTIEDKKDGFLFKDYSTKALSALIEKATSIYNTDEHYQMVRNAMGRKFSWEKSAKEYKDLYEKVIQLRKHQVEISN